MRVQTGSGTESGERLLDRVREGITRSAGETGLPLVTISYAQSIDGSIASLQGHPLVLSSPESMRFAHALRSLHEAILVGIGTVLSDDPRLNVRLSSGKDPQPVILDGRLRFPPYSKMLQDGAAPIIVTRDEADIGRATVLETAGARIVRLPGNGDGRISLSALLAYLSLIGIRSLLVEGGAQVITNFLSAQLADQIVVTIAPIMIGGSHVLVPSQSSGTCFPTIEELDFEQVGKDIVVLGGTKWNGA